MIKFNSLLLEQDGQINSVQAFIQRLSSIIGKQIDAGSSGIWHQIEKPEGQVYGKKFFIGAVQSIRLNFLSPTDSTPISIDIWLKPTLNPNFTVTVKTNNLLNLADPIAIILSTGKIENLYTFEDDEQVTEARKGKVPFNIATFVDYISQKTPVYTWAKKEYKKNQALENALQTKDMANLHRLYLNWARTNKDKKYSYAGFRNVILKAFADSRMSTVSKVEVSASAPDKYLVPKGEKKALQSVNPEEMFRLNPNVAYAYLQNSISAVLAGQKKGMLVSSPPQLGKTTTVLNMLQKSGYKMIEKDATTIMQELVGKRDGRGRPKKLKAGEKPPKPVMPKVEPIKGKQFLFVKGKTTTFAAYILMYLFNGAIIVFDDADAILADANGRNLVKGALDPSSIRKISMASARTMSVTSVIPSSFDYKGRIMFLSNMPLEKLDPDGALVNRGVAIELNFSFDEIYEYIKKISSNLLKGFPNVPNSIKEAVLKYLLELKGFGLKRLNFAIFINTVQLAMGKETKSNWKLLAGNLAFSSSKSTDWD